jgi:hypothetical protein
MRGSVSPWGYTTARSEAPRRSSRSSNDFKPYPDMLVASARIATMEKDGYSGSSSGYSRYCVQSEVRHAGRKRIMLMHAIMPCDIRGVAIQGVNRGA